VTCEACGLEIARCRCPRDASGRLCRPDQQRLTIRTEKRPGGRLVTLITGLDPHASPLAPLAAELRREIGTGGSAGDAAIELQGDHRQRAADILGARGYRVVVK